LCRNCVKFSEINIFSKNFLNFSATVPPFNFGVFGILVSVGICVIICFCGMSSQLLLGTEMAPRDVATAYLIFSLFSLLCAIVVGYGFFQVQPS